MAIIALDMMGGDFAPDKAFEGVEQFLQQPSTQSQHLLLIGDENLLRSKAPNYQIADSAFTIIHAPEVIAMHEHPTKALKEKPHSSIAIGFHLLATGKADAFISAGNTGAMMVGSLFSIKTIEGILRPTIGAYIPRENGKLGLLLDVGLNADCKPESLNQFAILGTLFSKFILDIDEPKTGLVNIGEEEGKGNILAQAAYPLLKENKHIHFVGNIEGRDVLKDKADVMVCEGFTGNVVLKLAESIHDIVSNRKIEDEYFARFNFESYGGVPVLGVSKPVIIGHGISGEQAFKNMINVAVRMIDTDLCGRIKQVFTA